MPKAKRIVKNDVVEKSINNAMNALSSAGLDCAKSIAVSTKLAKSYLSAAKRLSKKRAALAKRKKTATARLKKTANADNRKALKTVEKELTNVKKEISKLTPMKSANASELASLKASQKRIAAYSSSLEKADKILNKPKKKKRKKRATKTLAIAA